MSHAKFQSLVHAQLSVGTKRCKYWKKTGACMKGDQCTFAHAEKKKRRCFAFASRGSCKAGLDCSFDHVAVELPVRFPEPAKPQVDEETEGAASTVDQIDWLGLDQFSDVDSDDQIVTLPLLSPDIPPPPGLGAPPGLGESEYPAHAFMHFVPPPPPGLEYMPDSWSWERKVFQSPAMQDHLAATYINPADLLVCPWSWDNLSAQFSLTQ